MCKDLVFNMAAGGEVVAKYIGHKIAKTRWCPPQQGSIVSSDTFATGGWDDERSNKVCMWRIEDAEDTQKDKVGLPNEPILMCETDHIGNVSDLQFFDRERILVASSTGTVSLYYHNFRKKSLHLHQSWDALHHLSNQGCSCTCLAVNRGSTDIVTAGEDGCINTLALDQAHPIRTIDSADSTSINGITYVTTNEVIAVTMSGQVKLWDLRQATTKASKIMLLSGDRVPLLCIDKHPTQPHLLAAGGQDGVLSIWDMRQEHYPVTLLEGHNSELWEVKFHPQKPDHLFTCSEDGSLWQWDGTSMAATSLAPNQSFKSNVTGNLPMVNGMDISTATVSPWLSVDATKHRMETYSLLSDNRLSINSLDIESRHLLCGSDCEAIFVICDLILSIYPKMRMNNDGLQPWYSNRQKFGLRPSKSYCGLICEEGLAAINTLLQSHVKLLWAPALLYYTACMSLQMSFKELFEHLGTHVCDLEQRWKLVMRVKRLLPDCNAKGGSGQDQCYFEGAVKILRQAQDIDFKLLYTGKICTDEVHRIRRIARQDCIRLPYFLKDIVSYKRILEEMAILNGLVERAKRPLSCRSRGRASSRNKNKKKNVQNKFRVLSSPTRSRTHSMIPHPPLLSRRKRSLTLDED